MFNGKYKSINTVIENILRDTDYYNDMNQGDATEWAIRAMELIGAPMVHEEKISTVPVVNYRAELPVGLRDIVAVRDNKSHQTLVATNDEFILNYHDTVADPKEEDQLLMEDKPVRMFAYRAVNGYLFLNAKEGNIDIKHTVFPTDDSGCLLIPDVDRYMMAVEAYIIHKIDSKLARRGVISRSIAEESKQEWLWYVSSAHSKIATPNYDEAESMKNQINKIRSDSNAHDYGFEHLNTPTVKKF